MIYCNSSRDKPVKTFSFQVPEQRTHIFMGGREGSEMGAVRELTASKSPAWKAKGGREGGGRRQRETPLWSLKGTFHDRPPFCGTLQRCSELRSLIGVERGQTAFVPSWLAGVQAARGNQEEHSPAAPAIPCLQLPSRVPLGGCGFFLPAHLQNLSSYVGL